MFFVAIWERVNVMFTNIFFRAILSGIIAFDVSRTQPKLNPGEA